MCDPVRRGLPQPEDEAATFRPRALLGIACALVAAYLVARFLWGAVAAVIVGVTAYALFSPIVAGLARWRVPRVVTAPILLMALLGVAGFLGAQLVPRAYGELADVLRELPNQARRFEHWLRERDIVGDAAEPLVSETLESLAADLQQRLVGSWAWVLGQVRSIFGSLVAVLLGTFIGLYLLVSGPKLAASLPAWIPARHRRQTVEFGRRVSVLLTAYVQARFLASLFIGASYWVGFALLGIRQAALLALIGGVFNLVPVLGPSLALIPAVTVAAFHGMGQVVAVIVVTLVAQQIESGVIGPLLEGRFVRLPPLVVVLSATLGAALLGIRGLLIAVPVAAVTRAALDVFYRPAP